MSGGLTPCRQLRPSSRRELVTALNSQIGLKKKQTKKTHTFNLSNNLKQLKIQGWDETGLHVGSARHFGGSIGMLVTTDDMATQPPTHPGCSV